MIREQLKNMIFVMFFITFFGTVIWLVTPEWCLGIRTVGPTTQNGSSSRVVVDE